MRGEWTVVAKAPRPNIAKNGNEFQAARRIDDSICDWLMACPGARVGLRTDRWSLAGSARCRIAKAGFRKPFTTRQGARAGSIDRGRPLAPSKTGVGGSRSAVCCGSLFKEWLGRSEHMAKFQHSFPQASEEKKKDRRCIVDAMIKREQCSHQRMQLSFTKLSPAVTFGIKNISMVFSL